MIRPVILCGGAGTRLWPVSRQAYPKQFLSLTGDQSLLQQTADRLSGSQFAPAIVVSGEEQHQLVEQQLQQSGATLEAILLEPAGRNTASAAALAAAWLRQTGRDELILLMPSDHVIGNANAFIKAIGIGVPHAEEGAIVTFGASPTEPNTQFGYIEANTERGFGDGAFPVAQFVEKPSQAIAEQYVASGRFFWNAGIFLTRAETILSEMRQFLPASLDAVAASVAAATAVGPFVRPSVDFCRAENISIDHGIMERTSHGVVVPVSMGWSDVGSWDAVMKLGAADEDGNVTQGSAISIDTRNSLIRSEGGALVATIGLDEMAVIAVRDVVLVAPLSRVAEVKSVVEVLKEQTPDRLTCPAVAAGPEGPSETIARRPRFHVNRIELAPGQHLSRPSGADHPLYWLVISGSAKVDLDGQDSALFETESVLIPVGTAVELANAGDAPLEIVEIGFGCHLKMN